MYRKSVLKFSMYCVLKSALTDWGWDLQWQLSIFKRTICLISTMCLYVWCCVESPFYSCIYLCKHYDKCLKCCLAFSTFCRFLPCTPILLAEQAIVFSFVIRLCQCVFVCLSTQNRTTAVSEIAVTWSKCVLWRTVEVFKFLWHLTLKLRATFIFLSGLTL